MAPIPRSLLRLGCRSGFTLRFRSSRASSLPPPNHRGISRSYISGNARGLPRGCLLVFKLSVTAAGVAQTFLSVKRGYLDRIKPTGRNACATYSTWLSLPTRLTRREKNVQLHGCGHCYARAVRWPARAPATPSQAMLLHEKGPPLKAGLGGARWTASGVRL